MNRGEVIFVGDFLFGDEAKARIIDFLFLFFDRLKSHIALDVRQNGGPNAGHRVTVGDKSMAFHQIPSCALTPGVEGALGTGMVIDPTLLLFEADEVLSLNLPVRNRLYLSSQAQVIFPWHKWVEAKLEALSGQPVGTTGKGIGPAYATARERLTAIRVDDLRAHDFQERFKFLEEYFAHELSLFGSEWEKYHHECEAYYEAAKKMVERFSVTNITDLVWGTLERGGNVLIEGAQGGMLDVDHGTYPYVTSSTTTLPGLLHDIGWWDKAYMAVKAYTTRVGNGPLVGELLDEMGEKIGSRGHEVGETTGRKRRISWLDTVLIRWILKRMRTPYGRILAPVTKLDVLDTLLEVKIIVAYEDADGRRFEEVPSVEPSFLAGLKPVYQILPGWQKDTRGCRNWEDLPLEAKRFLDAISEKIGLPIPFVTVGAERSETVEIPKGIFPES